LAALSLRLRKESLRLKAARPSPRYLMLGSLGAALSLEGEGNDLLRFGWPFARASLPAAPRKTGAKRLTPLHDRKKMRPCGRFDLGSASCGPDRFTFHGVRDRR